MAGKTISQIAYAESAEVKVDGPNISVGDIYIMNIGLEDSQKKIKEHGMGIILKPKNANCRVTLANLGQRQAILHDLSTILGVYRDSGEPSMLPMAKLDMNDGRLGILILPQSDDSERALKAVRRVPVLESAVRLPSESEAGPDKAVSKG
jgi:hypothetical protein